MFKVGLSGNRFSGKDVICEKFKKIGIPVYDADTVIKFILNYNCFLIEEIRTKLGNKYYSDGKINLKEVNNNGKFLQVLKIIESDIFHTYKIFEQKNEGSIYTIFNSSVLFELDWQRKMDYTVTVYAPFIERVNRAKKILEYPHNNIDTINTLLCSETDELKKNKKANFTIHNYNEFNIEKSVHDLDQRMINTYLYAECGFCAT